MDYLLMIVPALCFAGGMWGPGMIERARARLHPRRAVGQLLLAQSRDPELARRYRLFLDARAARDWVASLSSMQACLSHRPDLSELHIILGVLQVELNLPEAEQTLARAHQLAPDDSVACAYLAMLLQESHPAEAARLARHSLRIDPHMTHAALVLAGSLLTAKEIPGCLKLLAQWLRPDGSLKRDWRRRRQLFCNPAILLQLRRTRGLALAQSKGWRRAMPDLTAPGPAPAALERSLLHARFHIELAQADYASAQQILEQLVQGRVDWLSTYLAGTWNYAQGRYAEALSAYQASLERAGADGERRESQARAGWCLWNLGRLEEAAAALDLPVPDRIGALLLAQLASDRSDWTGAAASLAQARALEPEDITLEELSGRVAEGRQDPQAARAHYRRCLELRDRGLLSWRPEQDRARHAQERLAALG